MSTQYELANGAYRLIVVCEGKHVRFRLRDLATEFDVADGDYVYRAARAHPEGILTSAHLTDAQASIRDDTLTITGHLAGLVLTHSIRLPLDRPILEEQIALCNQTAETVALSDLACGMTHVLTNEVGTILPELAADRFIAVPFRHLATDAADWDNDFDIRRLIDEPGRELRVNELAPLHEGHGCVPSDSRFSEGWTWMHGGYALAIYKFNQEAMEFSVLSREAVPGSGVVLRFGGAGMMDGEPACLTRIAPGETIRLGVTRLQTFAGDHTAACYGFRTFLDEHGCRFPTGFNPPVHWNELYDVPEWDLGTLGHPPGPRMTRPFAYTKTLLMAEAAKARDYGCEALYLDPGWDTDFATFLWGEAWLGDRQEFVRELAEGYGLKLSLHCPLATWMSWDGRGVPHWPEEAWRMDADGNVVERSVCLGAQQYLDEAERRLLANCTDGASYLMFDGNWWNGGCWNPAHGHPVPYTKEDHCRANLALAQRIHACYPDVIIEMHDMISGGSDLRYTPIYYKYGLPGSYDDNWGFELMWQPMEDLRAGRARALYYYNLGCNIPAYLHIDLRDDNEHCVVLWWYASTCRHLGIGGTHPDPAVAHAQRTVMQRYRSLDRFYKRGGFYGLNEEVHLHVLPEENAFVVNLFNLSDESRIISGTVSFDLIGLPRDRWYANTKGGSFNPATGTFTIRRRLPPWGAQVAEVRELQIEKGCS
jgi:hypothetical protein